MKFYLGCVRYTNRVCKLPTYYALHEVNIVSSPSTKLSVDRLAKKNIQQPHVIQECSTQACTQSCKTKNRKPITNVKPPFKFDHVEYKIKL